MPLLHKLLGCPLSPADWTRELIELNRDRFGETVSLEKALDLARMNSPKKLAWDKSVDHLIMLKPPGYSFDHLRLPLGLDNIKELSSMPVLRGPDAPPVPCDWSHPFLNDHMPEMQLEKLASMPPSTRWAKLSCHRASQVYDLYRIQRRRFFGARIVLNIHVRDTVPTDNFSLHPPGYLSGLG